MKVPGIIFQSGRLKAESGMKWQKLEHYIRKSRF